MHGVELYLVMTHSTHNQHNVKFAVVIGCVALYLEICALYKSSNSTQVWSKAFNISWGRIKAWL